MKLQQSVKERRAGIFWAILFILTAIFSYSLSGRQIPKMHSLDQSWMVTLEYATRNHFQFGKDLIFTHGPLGFLNANVSEGYFTVLRIMGALLLALLSAWALTGIARQIRGPVKYLFCCWALLFYFTGQVEEQGILIVVFGCLRLMNEPMRYGPLLMLLGSFSLLGLIKFTCLVLVLTGVITVSLVYLWQRKFREAVIVPSVFALFFVALWVAAGQHPLNLGRWFTTSLAVSSGYTDAMAIVPKAGILPLCLLSGACFLLVATIVLFKGKVSPERAGLVFIAGIALFLTWKHGLVRADEHVLRYIFGLPVIFGALFAIWRPESLYTKANLLVTSLYICSAMLCLSAAHIHDGSIISREAVRWPQKMRENAGLVLNSLAGRSELLFEPLQPGKLVQQRLTLAAAGKIIGNEPVDVMDTLSYVAIGNGFNYLPRPVIQSYTAYTPLLQEKNLDFFLSDRCPSYILMSKYSLDDHFPTMEDASALLFVFRNYYPVDRDSGFLVLKKAATASQLSAAPVLDRELRFGQRLPLDGLTEKPLVMTVNTEKNLTGRIISFLYQPPEIFIVLHFGNDSRAYRFVPAMAERGVLLNPLIMDTDDVLRFYTRKGWKRPDSISFSSRYLAGQVPDRLSIRLFQLADYPASIPDSTGDANQL